MKERLTIYTKTGCALKLDDPQNEIEARQQLMQKFRIACDKLAKFEDLMEKHNFESVEELANYIKKLELIIKKGKQQLEEYFYQQLYELDEEYNRDLEERQRESKQLAIWELKKFRADLVNNVNPVLLSYTEYVQKVFEKINQQIKKLEETK